MKSTIYSDKWQFWSTTDLATANVVNASDHALGRLRQDFVGRKVLLAGVQYKVVKIGRAHLGKRRMQGKLLSQVAEQAAGGGPFGTGPGPGLCAAIRVVRAGHIDDAV